jgi:hypothetical protein
MDYSLNSLKQWVEKQTKISQTLQTKTQDFLLKSFLPRIDKLGQCFYQHLYGGELGTNSISEQENAALKNDPMGPHNNGGINRTVEAAANHTNRRIKGLQRHSLLSLSQTNVKSTNNDSEKSDSDEELSESMKTSTVPGHFSIILSKYLVDSAVHDLQKQHKASVSYKFHIANDKEFYVRRCVWAPPKTGTTFYANIPKFDRTRVVTLINSKY